MNWETVRRWLLGHGREASSSTGPLLQFGSKQGSMVDAILGLDFGTSCSKGVVRLPFVQGGLAHAVPLVNGSRTEFFHRSLPPAHEGEEAVSEGNIKIRLMLSPSDEEARAYVALYLAGIARRSRGWFLTSQKRNYGQFGLMWSMNVGVPSSGFGNSELERGFLVAARAGWLMSLEDAAPTLARAKEALVQGELDESLPVYVIPEVIAAAEGYRRSAFARPGIHVIMDVGASTLDICAFILLSGPSGNPFGLAIPDVAELGSAVLHDARVRALGDYQWPGDSFSLDPRDPGCVVPDDLGGYVANGKVVPTSLTEVDARFQEDCESALRRVLGGMYQKNPLARYRDGIPLFLTGGGGHMKFYTRAIEHMKATKQSVAWSNVDVRRLERPDDLRPANVGRQIVSRMLVAYGLSRPRLDFGDFTNPALIPGIDPPARPRLRDYFGKDQM